MCIRDRYWWVNQKQTGHHEIPGGYIWAPIPTSNIVHHENVKHVQEGDIIFSYIRGEIVAIGVAQSNAYDANKPSEFSPSTPWRTEGRRGDGDFDQLTDPIPIKELTNELLPTLPEKYSPMNRHRGANQGYLYEIEQATTDILLRGRNHSLFEENPVERFVTPQPVDRITERIELRRSRVGQGRFRADVLARWDGQCAVSPINKPELLRASHIKPWSTCDNSQEKLDPFNGLALAQNYDSQFDSGFISFDEDGRIMISDRLEVWETQTMGISERARLRQIVDATEDYMKYHRDRIFLTS